MEGIIGKKVTYEFPISNNQKEKGEGVVVDKWKNSFVQEVVKKQPDGSEVLESVVVTYDNYLIVDKDNKCQALHPTLITSVEFYAKPKKV